MKRKFIRKRSNDKINKFPVLFLLFIFISIFIIGFNNRFKSNLLSKAEGVNTCRCNDPNRCFPDGCSRDNQKDPNVCPDNDLGPNMPAENNYLCYRPPDCCDAIVAANDAYRCCWVERGFCRKEQCAHLTGNRAKCGWYWDDHTGEGYGCSRVNVAPLPMEPTPTSISVEQPEVTTPPFEGPPPTLSIPTTIPRPTNPYMPTQGVQPNIPRPQITYIPIVYPINPSPPVPSTTPIPISWSNVLNPVVLFQTLKDTINYILPSMTFMPKSPGLDNYPSPDPKISGSITTSPTKNLLPGKEVKSFINTTNSNLKDFLSKILP